MARFEDHFSKRAEDYARYRPQYPSELFAYLASVAPRRRLAWDCGTGNGQAALGLAERFDRVVATDASSDQLSHAVAHERIEYRIQRAEDITPEPGGADLVAVAAAVHWFDLEPFYEAVRGAAAPQGVLAVWSYFRPVITPEVDRVLADDYGALLADYWPERFHYVSSRYRTLPFPFDELTPPEFEARATWTLSQLAGFVNGWSAGQRYHELRGEPPVNAILPALTRAWGDPKEKRLIRWPLFMRAGRVS